MASFEKHLLEFKSQMISKKMFKLKKKIPIEIK